MKLNSLSIAFVAAIISASTANASSSSRQAAINEQKAAELVAQLIQNGHASIDPTTGELQLKVSVAAILASYGLVESKDAPDLAPDKTGGAGSC